MILKNRQSAVAFLSGIVAVAACLCMWPGARVSFVIPAYMVVMAIVMSVFSACRWRSAAGAYILLAMVTLSTCGVVINVNWYTTVFSTGVDSPVLLNWDAATDWDRALYNLGLSTDPGLFNSRHLAGIAAGLMAVFGVDITVPIMFNVLCYGLTLVAMGSIAYAMTSDRRIALGTLVAGSTMCYLFTQSTWLIKDVPVTLCIAVIACMLVRWRMDGCSRWWEWMLLAVSMVLLLFLRANFMYMVALGAGLMALRRDVRRLDWKFIVVIVAAILMRMVYDHYFNSVSAEALITVDGTTTLNNHKTASRAWDKMHPGGYEDFSVGRRLLFLPASVAVQFLIPFPWNFGRDMIFAPTMVVAHFGYCWYYAGALILYWIFAAGRRSPRTMQLSAVWGVAMTVLTAWMSAGRVSRYCLPYLPLLLPCAAFVAVKMWRRRSLWVWLGVFTAILVPTLLVCHHLQMTAS